MGLQTYSETVSPALSGTQFPHPHRERFGWVISKSHRALKLPERRFWSLLFLPGWVGDIGTDGRKGNIPEADVE